MQASSADIHNQIASQYAPADGLPCADNGLLVPLKKSPEYRAIHQRLASPKAADSWQDEGLHFFVFVLTAADGTVTNPLDPPVVVFTMHPEEPTPLSVVVVTPKAGGVAQVLDVRDPQKVYTAPLPPRSQAAQPPPTSPVSEPEEVQVFAFAAGPADAVNVGPEVVADEPIAPDLELVDDVRAQIPDNRISEQVSSPTANLTSPTKRNAGLSLPLEASLSLLVNSPAYEVLQAQIAGSLPSDVWEEEGLHFFVFQLHGIDAVEGSQADVPVVVFTMRPDDAESVSVVTVSPILDGEKALITDVRAPERAYTVPL